MDYLFECWKTFTRLLADKRVCASSIWPSGRCATLPLAAEPDCWLAPVAAMDMPPLPIQPDRHRQAQQHGSASLAWWTNPLMPRDRTPAVQGPSIQPQSFPDGSGSTAVLR